MTAFDELVAKEDNINLTSVIEVRVSEAVARERLEKMVKNGAVLDDRSINLAFGMMGDVARRLTEDQENRDKLRRIVDVPDGPDRDEQLKKFHIKNPQSLF